MMRPLPSVMHGFNHRLRFAKRGDLRYLSHLDLMRSVERLCRRAAIPFKSSQGFHPAPRVLYPLSLPLGAIGHREVLELELTQPLEPNELLDRFRAHAPAGLEFISALTLPDGLVGMARRAEYVLPLQTEQFGPVQAAVDQMLQAAEVWLPRLRPRPRLLNIRPYIRGMAVQSGKLWLEFWITPQGTARAEEVIELLGLPPLARSEAVLERTNVELHDEVLGATADGPPTGPPQTQPLKQSPREVHGDLEHAAATATWGLSPNGPVVE